MLEAIIGKAHIMIERNEEFRARLSEPLSLLHISFQAFRQFATDRNYPVLTSLPLIDEDGQVFEINIGKLEVQQFLLAEARENERREHGMVTIPEELIFIRIVVDHLKDLQGFLLGQLGRQSLLQPWQLYVIRGIMFHDPFLDTPPEEDRQRFMNGHKRIG